MEIVKFIQVYFINWDVDLYYAARDIPFQCRALNINEDLGQIQYVFSDKTGTLTENEMRFQCCTIAGVNYPHQLKGETLPCVYSETCVIRTPWDQIKCPDYQGVLIFLLLKDT